MTRTAVILAGGKGLRLRPVIQHLPKPMAPIHDRPFLDYLIAYLSRQGIHNIILSVGYMQEVIRKFFGNKRYQCSIRYAVEDDFLGTGGALAFAAPLVEEDFFFALNGDSFFALDYTLFYKKSHTYPFSIALHQTNEASRYGQVSLREGHRVFSFEEKKKHSGPAWINGGVYHIEKNFFITHAPRMKSFSLEKEALPLWTEQGYVYGFQMSGYFIDIGIPEDYERAGEYFKKLEY